MAIRQKFISLDEYFRSISSKKLILNDFSMFDQNHKEEFHNTMVKEYNSDNFSILPKCSCGKYVGELYKGYRCEDCGCIVDEMSYDPIIWAKAFTPDRKFLNPMYFQMLNNLLSKDIQYLVGVTNETRTKNNICGSIARNVLHNDRTYKNFLLNIRNILIYVNTLSQYQSGPKAESVRLMLELWDTQSDILLSEYLPMINNVLFNVTKTNKGKYLDTGFASIYDVATMWMRVANDYTATEQQLDKTTGKAVCSIGVMPEFYIKNYLSGKPGIFRKHVYGCRSPFTFRSVIVSRPGRHRHDEVVAPWVTLVSVLRPYMLNKLMRRYDMSYMEASNKILKAAKAYDKDIEDIGKELISEAKQYNGRGISIIIHRNPSLYLGSAQLMYIIAFDNDVENYAIQFPQLSAKAPNADYDGDKRIFKQC